MPFPLIPVAVTAGLAGLGFLLFGKKDEAPPKRQIEPPQISPQPAPAPLPLPLPNQQILPPPIVPPIAPIIPTPVNVLPGPAPLPAPVPLPNVLPNIIPNIIPNVPNPPVTPPSPVEPTGQTATVLGNPGANLRANPNATSAILAGIFAGARVKILDPNRLPATAGAPQGWFKVLSAAGMTGFMSAEFLRLDSGGAVPLPPTPFPLPNVPNLPNITPSALTLTGTILGNPGTNLRGTPIVQGSTVGAGSNIIVGLFNGSKVKVLNPIPAPPTTGAPKGWINIETASGQRGFVSAEFIRLDTPNVTGERSFFMPGREGNLRRRNYIRG